MKLDDVREVCMKLDEVCMKLDEVCMVREVCMNNNLREVCMKLDEDFGILECEPSSRFLLANESCDLWRLMLRHCLEMKRSRTTTMHDGLQAVLDVLVDDLAADAATVLGDEKVEEEFPSSRTAASSSFEVPRTAEGFVDFSTLSDLDEDAMEVHRA